MAVNQISVSIEAHDALMAEVRAYRALRAIVTNDMRAAGHALWPNCDCPYTDIYLAMDSAKKKPAEAGLMLLPS